jgi:hypothetical protein
MYYGSWAIDNFVTFSCNTHNTSTGASADADAEPSYRVYEDETATPVATGTLSLLDSDNTTGFYSERLQLTAAAGFEKSKSYTIYISATVNSIAGTTSHSFQIEAEVDANTVSDKTGYTASTVSDKTGYSLSVTPPTAAAIADAVWDEPLADHDDISGQAGHSVVSILVDTSMMGTSGSGLSAIPWNAAWDAPVQSECTDALNAFSNLANLDAKISSTGLINWAAESRTLTGGVTVTTNNDKTGYTASTVSDKTGYSLSVTPPTAQNIWEYTTRTLTSSGAGATAQEVWEYTTREVTGGTVGTVSNPVTAGTVSDKTGYTVSTNQDKTGYSLSGGVTVTTNNDKTGYSGVVTDKTGFSLAVTPPTASDNATAVWGTVTKEITGGTVGTVSNPVTAGTVSDKTGYSITGTVTVGTNNDKTGYTVSTVSDKTGYALSGAGVTAVQSGLATGSALATVDGLVDTLISQVLTIYDIETGKWDLTNDVLSFYKADGTTPVISFTITNDDDGNPVARERI